MIDQHHDVLLDFTTQHPFDDFHGFFIGDAHAPHERPLLADLLECIVNLRATAMDHDRIHANQLEQNHVTCKSMLETLFSHRITAVFDDDGLAVELADVGQGFGQDFGLDLR